MTSIELLKERHLMDFFFSSQLILMSWHLEHNSKAAQELASLDSVQIVLRFAENYSSHLFTHHQKQNPWVAIGPPEKPHPLVLNKAETMKFDGASSRVGKVVDSVLQTSVGRPQDDELD